MDAEVPRSRRHALIASAFVLALAAAGLFAHPRETSIENRELAFHLEGARSDASAAIPSIDSRQGPEGGRRAPLGTLLLSSCFEAGAPRELRTARLLAAALGLLALVVLNFGISRTRGPHAGALVAGLVLLHPAFLETFREGGRGATAVLMVLLAGLVGAGRPPSVGGRLGHLGLLTLAVFAAGPWGVVLSWFLRAAATRDSHLGWQWTLGASAFAAFLFAFNVFAAMPTSFIAVAPTAVPEAWPVCSIAILAGTTVAAGLCVLRATTSTGSRALASLGLALLLPLAVPVLRAPWALALLPLPSMILLAMKLPEATPVVRRSLEIAALLFVGFVAGRTIADLPWLSGTAWYTGSALLVASALALYGMTRPRWSPLIVLIPSLMAVTVLVGFTLSLHPRAPSAFQMGPMLRRAHAQGARLFVDPGTPELAFAAGRVGWHQLWILNLRMKRRFATQELWMATSPEGSDRIDSIAPPERHGISFTLESLGRRLVLRQLLPR